LICPISLIFSAGILYTNLQNVTTFEVESYYAYGRRHQTEQHWGNKKSCLLSEERLLVIHELQSLLGIHVREQGPGEVVVVPAADVGAVELLGDGDTVVETNLQPDTDS